VAVQALCQACGARTTANGSQAGQQISCSACRRPVMVPAPPAGFGRGPNGTHAGSASGSGFGRQGPGNTQVVEPRPGPNGTHAQRAMEDTRGDSRAGFGPAGTHAQHGSGSAFGGPGGGSAFGGPTGSSFGAPTGSSFGSAHGGFGQQGSAFGGAQAGAAFGTPVSDSAFQLAADRELPPNIAPDDPIAHAMSTRQNADGTVETVFGPYDIIGEIARGGMGIVYRARQRSLKRIVALKVMKEGENASEKQIRRFKRETEAAAKLQHPNIVAVHEVGCHEGFHYFTMDLIEGDPLDAIVKRKEKMPVNRVLEAVAEVAHAIHYAHGKGIIHRDLKPANVLLDTDGHPKVTDFGLAKQIDHKSMLTRTGAVVGTPFYMPPEQARGDVDIDQKADVYALGVILYELLTLKLPFHGETTMEVYHKILEEEPLPPRKHDSRIDKDVNTIVLKAMEKDLGRRYQSALELAEDIERYLQGDPIKARPLGPIGRAIKKAKKNMPVVIVASITVFALFGSVGLIIWRQQRALRYEFEINKKHEFDTFTTEVDNRCANARSQITSGKARMRDRDPEGALADLEEAERILEDLPLLTSDYAQFNEPPENQAHLDEKADEINEIYQEVYLETGKAHAMQKTEEAYVTALDFFERGLEKTSGESGANSLLLHLETGRVQAQQGKFEQALATFAGIIEADGEHVAARLETGRVHALAGAFPQAIESYTHVIESNAKAVRAYLLRGQTYFTLGRNEDALRDFAKVLDLEDDLFDGYIWKGRTHQALGHFGEAQEHLTEAIDITPSLPDGYFYRAELHFEQRKHAQAIKDYEVAISRSPQYYEAYLGLGRALEWVLDYERARQQYDEILQSQDREAQPVKARAQAALATLELVQADAYECRQEEELRSRQEAQTSDGSLGPSPPADKLEAGSEALRSKRMAAAKSGFEEALRADPDLIEGLHGRARVALLEGDVATARKHLGRSMKLLAERPSVRFQQGDAGDSAGDDESEWEDDDWGEDDDELLGEEVQSDALLAEAHVLLGRAALAKTELDAASKAFGAALRADPRSAAAQAGLALVALGRKDDEAAAEAFGEARELMAQTAGQPGYFHAEGIRFQGLAERSKKPEYYKQARQAYARALVGNRLHSLALFRRAKLAADWKAYDVAVALAGEAVAVDPFLREAYELRGMLFTRTLPAERNPETKRPKHLRDYARGRKEFDRAIEVAADRMAACDAFYGRALAVLAAAGLPEGEGAGPPADKAPVEQARKDLEVAIKAIPTDFRAAEPHRINQAIAYLELFARVHRLLGDEAGAAKAVERVKAVEEKAREAARQELLEGRALRDRLNYSEAIKHFDRAIELNDEFSEAYYDRGTCYLKIGNFVPGILDFSRALELDPRIADQVYNKVYQISYVVDLNRVITELNKIVSDHPDESHVVFLRGFFYVAKTEFKQVSQTDLELGITDFDNCLKLNPTHVTAFLYRGFLWFKMGTRAEGQEAREGYYVKAKKDYLKALELDPVSGISHYLQALCWSVHSSEEWLSDEQKNEYRQRSLAELKKSFDCAFKGYERIRNEKGFDAVRNMPEFKKLMRGK
jgi:serine/threonine protein kinase/Tfp pilus assembly protein PilF